MLPIPSAFWSREAARVVLDGLRRLAGPGRDLGEAGEDDRARMASEIEDFVVALNRDLISAEDFRLADREGRRQ